MALRAGYLVIAEKLQEAATAMCHEDIRTRLSDALNDAFRGTGTWCYLVAVFGDDKSGDVVYSCSSDLKKASYTLSGANCTIDTAGAVDVQPLTTYEVEGVEATEAGARNSKRDLRQLQTIHDSAASMGANCSMAESAKKAVTEGALKLFESAATVEQIVIREAKADYEIKLIAPGKGSSAFYPKEVLQRDGPGVFKSGTHVYINHPTLAEEAARPEGDVKNLAGVLTSAAEYHESHAKGPGLYARMKVFADHGAMVEEKAAHVGMSIRASGIREDGGRMRDGVPVLKALTSAESVDVVTRAGAGGMILTEAARAATEQQESVMTEDEVKKLVEAGVATAVGPLKQRALRGDAVVEASRLLSTVSLPEASRQRVIDNVLREALPVNAAGELDATKLTEAINAEAKREGAYVASLTGSGRVYGMGAGAPAAAIDPTKLAEAKAQADAAATNAISCFEALGMPGNAAKLAATGRAN